MIKGKSEYRSVCLYGHKYNRSGDVSLESIAKQVWVVTIITVVIINKD